MRGDTLLSECGKYRLGPPVDPKQDRICGRPMYDAATGDLVCHTTFWRNRYTSSRVRFETGSGAVEAMFSYPMYPRWFRRRWVSCFDVWIDDLARFIEDQGGMILVAYKPDINCWCHIGFKANRETAAKIDAQMTANGWDWHGPPRKPGGWNISCPNDPDGHHEKILQGLAARVAS